MHRIVSCSMQPINLIQINIFLCQSNSILEWENIDSNERSRHNYFFTILGVTNKKTIFVQNTNWAWWSKNNVDRLKQKAHYIDDKALNKRLWCWIYLISEKSRTVSIIRGENLQNRILIKLNDVK